MPVTLNLVCLGSTATSIPAGSGYSMGCENPSVNTTMFLPFNSARYPMPTISSSFVQPLVTPSTALLTRARARPCTAAWESFSRTAMRCPSCCWTLIPAGRCVSNLPFGPWTATVSPSILTVTPLGSGIGFFPIRDIKFLVETLLATSLCFPSRKTQQATSLQLLPNFAEEFASKSLLARLPSGHHAARRGQDVDSHATQHARNLRAPHIHPAPGTRYARHIRNRGLIIIVVLQVNA